MNKKLLTTLICAASLCAVAGLAACNPHEHSYSAEVISPTCTESGYTKHTCSCGDSYTDEQTQPLGHNYTTVSWEWDGLSAATATFTCSHNAEHKERLTANVTSEITTPATCTVEGERTYTAKVTFNGKEYKDRMYEPIAPSHTLKNNVCVDCGYSYGSKGLNLLLNTDTNTYSVIGIGTCTDTVIVIPSTFNDIPVTTIEDSAFANCEIVEVTLDDNVTTVKENAFSGCSQLTKITFCNSMESFYSYSFESCNNLTDIYYNGDISDWCSIAGLQYLLANSNSSEKNLYFNSKKVEGEVVIPSDVSTIASYAFAYVDGITSVKVESGVRLSNFSFKHCSSLESITLDKDIDSIGSSVFQNCDKLKSIIYNGTVEQWNNITKSSSWNSTLSDLTITCTDGKLDKDGNPTV